MYVLKRTDQGGGYYAAEGGYTDRLEKARAYRSRESADNDRCIDNEVVVDLNDIFNLEG